MPKSIVFFHPDLGIGGAERLVVDAAIGLQFRGHRVTIFTSHCDKTHCFTEAKDGSLDIRVRGNSIVPSAIFGRLAIFCAVARQLHLILSIAVFSSELRNLQPTHFIVDQLSACVPLLRQLSANYSASPRILFYCHFPDQLLATKGTGLLKAFKAFYRLPFDALESWSTRCSDEIVVNSKFTSDMVKRVFPGLRHRDLKIIYPCVDTGRKRVRKAPLWPDKRVVLSINRFERKKDAALALKAFAALNERDRERVRLVIAGGYDPRLQDNVDTLQDLQAQSDGSGLRHSTLTEFTSSCADKVPDDVGVLFLPSISDKVKQALLDSATLLVYTPRNEHFGIVPLEAMLNGVPVLAANEGGPVETVIQDKTGWLRNAGDVAAWTDVMRNVLDKALVTPQELERMGLAGQMHVDKTFSKTTMALRFEQCLDAIDISRHGLVFDLPTILVSLSLVLVTTGAVAYAVFGIR